MAIVVVVAVTLLFGAQFKNFQVTADFASFLPEDSETLNTSRRIEGAFGAGRTEFVMVKADASFSAYSMQALQPLVELLRSIKGVSEVVTPMTAPPPLAEQLVSTDGKNVLLQLQVEPQADAARLLESLSAAVAAVELPPGVEAFVAGPLSVEAELAEASQTENGMLFGIALLAIIAVVWCTFWRLRPVLLAVAIVLLAVVWALGAVVGTGQTITVISFSAIILIIALGIDYVIHFVRRVDEAYQAGESSWFEFAARTTGRSIMLAVVTTVFGFLSFLTVGFPPIAQFGLIAALGVISAFILTVVIIPALYVPAREGKKGGLAQRLAMPLQRVGRAAFQNKRTVWTAVVILCAASIVGLTQVEIGSPPLRLDTPAQKRLDELEGIFGALRTATILVDATPGVDAASGAGDSGGLEGGGTSASEQTPWRTNQVEPLLASVSEVDGVRVLAPWYQERVIPIPGWVSGDLARIVVQYEAEAASRVIPELKKALAPYREIASLTGRDPIQDEMEGRTLGSLGTSTAVAFGLILLVLTLFIGSLRLALVTLMPVVLVIWWQLGTMPLLGIRLSSTTVTTAALVLGVGIDYAVHVVERIQEERADGATPTQAVGRLLSFTGPGIVSGALTTAVGFFILGSSNIANLRDYGLLTGVAVIYSILVTLLVLPQVVVFVEKGERHAKQREAS